MTGEAVEVRDLTKVFTTPLAKLRRLLRKPSKNAVVALRNINLSVQPGEIFGLVGRNGQGKTTLVKSIAALLIPTNGSVKVFDFDTVQKSQDVKKRIGLVTSDERSFYWRLSGRQNMKFFARLYNLDEQFACKQIEELFDIFQLKELGERAFNQYSNGNKQRLALARALLTDPPLMLLDEPTRSLDPIAADELRGLIRERINASGAKTVLITSHNLTEVEQLCTRIAIISRGEIKECASLEELRTKYLDRERIFLKVRGLAIKDGVFRTGDQANQVAWEKLAHDTWAIRFTRCAEDGELHYVLGKVLALGGEILSCESNRMGLKEIMEQVDKEEDS